MQTHSPLRSALRAALRSDAKRIRARSCRHTKPRSPQHAARSPHSTARSPQHARLRTLPSYSGDDDARADVTTTSSARPPPHAKRYDGAKRQKRNTPYNPESLAVSLRLAHATARLAHGGRRCVVYAVSHHLLSLATVGMIPLSLLWRLCAYICVWICT